jgi:hypothetical protein
MHSPNDPPRRPPSAWAPILWALLAIVALCIIADAAGAQAVRDTSQLPAAQARLDLLAARIAARQKLPTWTQTDHRLFRVVLGLARTPLVVTQPARVDTVRVVQTVTRVDTVRLTRVDTVRVASGTTDPEALNDRARVDWLVAALSPSRALTYHPPSAVDARATFMLLDHQAGALASAGPAAAGGSCAPLPILVDLHPTAGGLRAALDTARRRWPSPGTTPAPSPFAP